MYNFVRLYRKYRGRVKGGLGVGAIATLLTLTLPGPVFSQFTPMFESVTLTPRSNFGEVVMRGISGGELPARSVSNRPETPTGPCVGFVDQQPDHIVTLTDYFDFLNIRVKSSGDTTLVIQGPGGVWCNDDAFEDDPAIAGEWLAGTYQIWVGSYERNEFHPYIMRITRQP
ncbi:hypothetical protein K4A83_15020 [Spirulina subsalsa FACHB-351]|uniref:Uncharacterized protein n=1 Tax=Spirulina subsalsa FACHB-351 TaxID=234711 RepID=A0ABT3L802_9CYAN|nr:hypothetical protein [Spirulina subsalsa]MCW6037577.1 hypothetical protein [Spirulina subsalsa FACHB-351]